MEAASIGLKVFGAFQQIQQGRAQQAMYNKQAEQALMQAKQKALQNRTEALNHKRTGIEVLKKMAQNLSTINARAAAGSIDPFSGSVDNLAMANTGKGAIDFYTSTENQALLEAQAKINEAGGTIQSAQLILAGNMAKRQGYINAAMTIGSAAMDANSMGGFTPTTPTGSQGSGQYLRTSGSTQQKPFFSFLGSY